MKKLDLYKLRDALEHALFLIYQEEPEPEAFNWWDKDPVICEINGYRWHLGPEADNKLNWDDAKNWCESVGGELPPREVFLMAYLNEGIRPLFKPEWYWSSTELDETLAFLQAFYDDGQDNNFFKTDTNYVRAVKRVKI